jgi:DNA (cytosine-5)-methyltransferase 1
MKKINQLDLFSGIGGFHLGFEKAGYKVKSYFSEVDKHAIAVYKHKFKDSEYVGSVTDVRGADLPSIDLITFGSPCQDFSLAGKRKGMGGERSSLILEAIRLIGECRPRVFIWENVKGTFSSNSGEDFAAILQAFAHIGGYRLEWQLLNTSWFLPQNRERIYLVGYSTNTKRNWRGVFPIGEATKVSDREKWNERQESTSMRDKNSLARTLNARAAFGQGSDDTFIKVKSATAQGYEVATEGDSINLSNPNSETRRGRVGKGKAQTLETSCNQAVVEPKIIGYTRDAKGKEGQDTFTIRSSNPNGVKVEAHNSQRAIVHGTLTEAIGRGGSSLEYLNSINLVNKAQPNFRIRKLTPIECERLQGFPDNHTEYGNYDGEVKKMSNTQRYKQCGNAVTTDVVQAIAEKIKPLFK